MTKFALIIRLVTSRMWLHPSRMVIATLGVIASTCAVVWVVSGYDALVSQFDENAGKYLGRYDALVMAPGGPPGAPTPTIQESLVDELKADAGVLEANPISNSRASVIRVRRDGDAEEEESALGLLVGARPPVNGAPPVDPTLVSTPAAEPPYELTQGRWLGDDPEARTVVVGSDVAAQMDLALGDEVLVTTFGNQVRLQVIGIVEQAPQAPSLSGPERGGPERGGAERGGAERGGAERGRGAGRRGGPGGPSASGDAARQSGDAARQSGGAPQQQVGLPSGFVQGIATNAIYVRPEQAARINGFSPKPHVLQIALRDTVTIEEFRRVWQERLAAGTPPLQVVDFDDVRAGMESSRSVSGQLSQAWAATGMASLAAIFIIFTTLSMGVSERAREFAMLRAVALTRLQVAGIIAVESVLLALIGWCGGLVAGAVMVAVGAHVLPGLFSSGATLGWTSIALTGVTVLVGALGAALLPAWRAMRIQPLDAMTTRVSTPRFRWWVVLGVLGMGLCTAAPLTVFLLPMSDEWRTWFYTFVTYPLLLLGMILIAPAVVVLCERVFAPIVTAVLRLDPRMMESQLSNNLWRTVGATLALSVGLGLFASTQIWGYSMLVPFMPGDWMPDALVAFHPVGLSEEDENLVRQVPSVKPDEVMPLAIEQAKFDWGDAGAPTRLRFGDNGIVWGLDPQEAFGGERPMLPVTFVDGDRETAIKAIASTNACIITEDLAMAANLKTGDSVTFIPPSADHERVQYKIAAVVSLPGWQWVTKFSGVRRHFVRTGAVVFADREQVSRDFHLGRTEFFWLNLDEGADLAAVESDFQSIAERHRGETFAAVGIGEITSYRPFARLTATETVRRAISLRADDMIWGMSFLPLVTLCIMSLAIANTVIASVRSRTWEFGVMRAIGVTRGQLTRLILAETVLIGAAACVLSLTFGVIAGWCGVGMAQFGGWFAGPPTFRGPWGQLAIGFAMTIGICLLAGMGPALQTGRAELLGLLRAGRTA